jgi:hypothetical protein
LEIPMEVVSLAFLLIIDINEVSAD